MIRITAKREKQFTSVMIDGRVEDSDLTEIRRIRRTMKGSVFLNLLGVESCAVGGVALLREWLAAGAKLADATPFLRMILETHEAETQSGGTKHKN